MATTYDPIASTTLTSSASSVTFSSLDTIAAGYRDLVVKFTAIGTSGGANCHARLNGDSGYNYYFVYASGNGSSASSGGSNIERMPLSQVPKLNLITPFTAELQLMDFSTNDKHKTVLSRSGMATGGTEMTAHRWANTSDVVSISIEAATGSFAVGAVFSLFGIAA